MSADISAIDPRAFKQTITLIKKAACDFQDPWWLIGSAAAKIAGAKVNTINDIDLLMSIRDIETLKCLWRDIPVATTTPSTQFQSKIFYRFQTPLPVEAMAEFKLRKENNDWITVTPQTRQFFDGLYAPEATEQIALLKLMNRPKDVQRINALKRTLS